MPSRVVVVGGGIAGLAVAREIRRLGGKGKPVEVLCLEASDRTGGNIRTDREKGYVCEWGPNGFLDNVPATLKLARDVGLADRLQPADASSAIRWIYRKGRLRRVPDTPPRFLGSDVLSLPGKLRVLWEPFARRRPEGDESVYDFAARRIGAESARVLVGAMVTGIYAGDARQLSLRATFPKMYAMESEYGGLFRAMLGKAREAKRDPSGRKAGGPAGPGGHLTSFLNGFEELPAAVARDLGPALRLSIPVEAVSDMGRRGFRVLLRHGPPIEADAVVLASPSWVASQMVRDMDGTLASTLAEIPSAALAVVHLGYENAAMPRRPEGFGFLVPRGEGIRILGTLYSSNIFPGRAPKGKTLLTAMAGGAHDPEILGSDDESIVRAVRRDLATVLGLTTAPTFIRVFRHPTGIPQYTLGHPARLEAIEARLREHPGLFVHGNSYRGISVNLCVERAPEVAESVLAHLEGRTVGESSATA